MPRRHNLPKRANTMPPEDLEGVLSTIHAIEKFAGRLPEGDVEGHIRRSAHELTVAVEQRGGVEAACMRLMQAVRQLDEHHTAECRRRDFEERSTFSDASPRGDSGTVGARAEARRLIRSEDSRYDDAPRPE
jgi:hypothetical protein